MCTYSLDTSLAQDIAVQLSPFQLAYIESAMWLLTDEDGRQLDYLGLHDISRDTIRAVCKVCEEFEHANRADLDALNVDAAQHGHDFYLTRNRHGVGFWDRGYPTDISGRLTDAAHAYGEDYWFLDSDGVVYASCV